MEDTTSRAFLTPKRIQSTVIWIVVVATLCAIIAAVVKRWKYVYMLPRATRCVPLSEYPFQTGDLIIVCTETRKEGFFNLSVAIKFFCGTPWNHVGVVYVDPHTQEPYLWEMVGSGLTRLIPISDIPDDPFAAHYFVRSINRPCDPSTMQCVMRQQWTNQFNYDIMMPWYSRHMSSVTCANGVRWANGRQKTCSQLAAEVYQALGIMDFTHTGVDVSELFPSDYAGENGTGGKARSDGRSNNAGQQTPNGALPMVRGAQFGPLVELTFARQANPRSKQND